MKQRNLLLAVSLLALFVASGVLYFYSHAGRKPFGVILFVGEGLVTGKLAAARLYDGGADRRLTIDSLPHIALLSTHAADFAVPDAASAASALSCGVKVNHRALATDPAGLSRETLFEIARRQGRATGLVTNGRLTDPTPAAFYAHATDCRDRDPLAAQLADRAGLDVMLGGGAADFVPAAAHGQRRDGRDLPREMARRGYALLDGQGNGLQVSQPWIGAKLLGLFGPDALKPQGSSGEAPGSGNRPPSLSEMTRAAIENLQRRAGGYLLVVDAGLVGRASQANDGERVLQELLELDRAVAVALQYAGTKTLVVVAGGESTGGMTLNGYPMRQDHGVSLLGMNAEGLPSMTWATGPAGPQGGPGASSTPRPLAPAAWYAPSAANVIDNALGAGFGPGSERLRGFQDNTFVFTLLNAQL